jgi:hypothetical protein
MSLAEWRRLMLDSAMLDSRFTKRESHLCVIYSICFVADEVRAQAASLAATAELAPSSRAHAHRPDAAPPPLSR